MEKVANTLNQAAPIPVALIYIRLYDCCAQSFLLVKHCISSEDENVYRYGIQLSKGILGLHSIGLLVLNLKPSNFLLSENDQLILGDLGLPYLLLGFPLADSDMALRLGTPNYMAPEQWEPEVRGPISLETDTWGFGCSIVEMLTGIQPWFGKSIDEIHHSVVIKQVKPYIPSGLPPAMENVLKGCFEYDLRNRPLMVDILHVFERYFLLLLYPLNPKNISLLAKFYSDILLFLVCIEINFV